MIWVWAPTKNKNNKRNVILCSGYHCYLLTRSLQPILINVIPRSRFVESGIGTSLPFSLTNQRRSIGSSIVPLHLLLQQCSVRQTQPIGKPSSRLLSSVVFLMHRWVCRVSAQPIVFSPVVHCVLRSPYGLAFCRRFISLTPISCPLHQLCASCFLTISFSTVYLVKHSRFIEIQQQHQQKSHSVFFVYADRDYSGPAWPRAYFWGTDTEGGICLSSDIFMREKGEGQRGCMFPFRCPQPMQAGNPSWAAKYIFLSSHTFLDRSRSKKSPCLCPFSPSVLWDSFE